MTLHLDLFQSAGVGVCALLLGMLFTRNIPFLKRFCIPAPVSGGLLVSLITLLLYSLGVECTFDGSVKDLCMMLFFTSVGFQSDMKALKQGGKPLLVMIGLVAVLIAAQNDDVLAEVVAHVVAGRVDAVGNRVIGHHGGGFLRAAVQLEGALDKGSQVRLEGAARVDGELAVVDSTPMRACWSSPATA